MKLPPKTRILRTSMIIVGIMIATLLVLESLALVVLYRQLAGNKTYWQERSAQPIPDNAIRYVALGDSAAQGVGAMKPEKGYVGLIAAALEKKFDRPVHVTNLSVSGAKIQDVIDAQLPLLEKLNLPPDATITIEVGANDMSSYNGPQFSLEMDELMSRLPSQTIISDLPYFGGGRARSLEPSVIKANKAIVRIAAKYNLRLAALHQVTKENENIRVFAADFFHPSNQGYRNWYTAFWRVID